MTTASNEPASDGIVAGIHRIRKQLLDEYQGDLRAYFESAVRRQRESKRPLHSEPLKPQQLQAGGE